MCKFSVVCSAVYGGMRDCDFIDLETVVLPSQKADRGLQTAHRITSELQEPISSSCSSSSRRVGRALHTCAHVTRSQSSSMQLLRPVVFTVLCTRCDNPLSRSLFLCAAYAPPILIDTWWPSVVNTPPRSHRKYYGILAHVCSTMNDMRDVNMLYSCTLSRHFSS